MAGMCPNELYRIELGCTGRKGVHMQARFRVDEVLDQTALVNGMVIPDQNNWTGNAPQQLLEE